MIGDLILDKYYHGSVSRISPEAPVPVVVKQYEKTVPGGAANVANNLKKLGCKTRRFAFDLLIDSEVEDVLQVLADMLITGRQALGAQVTGDSGAELPRLEQAVAQVVMQGTAFNTSILERAVQHRGLFILLLFVQAISLIEHFPARGRIRCSGVNS